MKTNISSTERVLRIIFGLFLMSFMFWGPSSTWFFLGIIPMATGIIGYCPLYNMFGVNTFEYRPQNRNMRK